MKQGLSKETRQHIVGGFAAEDLTGTKSQMGVMLKYLCASADCSRANARRRLAAKLERLERFGELGT